jgi:hypothetical protein
MNGQPDTGVPTHVDIKSLQDAIPRLEYLKHYLQTTLIPYVGKMYLSKNYGDLFFGGLDSAPTVYNKHNGYVKAAVDSYRDIAHALDIAAEATKSIVQNYKDAEHNTSLNVAAVEKAFTDNTGGGTTTTTSSSGNGSTQGSF